MDSPLGLTLDNTRFHVVRMYLKECCAKKNHAKILLPKAVSVLTTAREILNSARYYVQDSIKYVQNAFVLNKYTKSIKLIGICYQPLLHNGKRRCYDQRIRYRIT